MTLRNLLLPTCFGILLTAQGVPNIAQAASPDGKPLKLEHMDYAAARKLILGYGWTPMSGHCEQLSEKTCAAFPEIASCSGTGLGYCGMVFIKQDKCLYVLTTGGEPGSAGDGSTQVEKVTFRHGPCVKN